MRASDYVNWLLVPLEKKNGERCRNKSNPATLAGITHLVEHAVLRMVQPVTLPHGGIVKEDSMEFYASGEAQAIAGFLNAVAAAISTFSAITEEDLALEKTIIEAENPTCSAPCRADY